MESEPGLKMTKQIIDMIQSAATDQDFQCVKALGLMILFNFKHFYVSLSQKTFKL